MMKRSSMNWTSKKSALIYMTWQLLGSLAGMSLCFCSAADIPYFDNLRDEMVPARDYLWGTVAWRLDCCRNAPRGTSQWTSGTDPASWAPARRALPRVVPSDGSKTFLVVSESIRADELVVLSDDLISLSLCITVLRAATFTARHMAMQMIVGNKAMVLLENFQLKSIRSRESLDLPSRIIRSSGFSRIYKWKLRETRKFSKGIYIYFFPNHILRRRIVQIREKPFDRSSQ